MSSHFHSQEREGGRESEEGGKRGESSSGHFYLTPTKVLGKGNAKGLAIFMGRKRETLDQNMLMFQKILFFHPKNPEPRVKEG